MQTSAGISMDAIRTAVQTAPTTGDSRTPVVAAHIHTGIFWDGQWYGVDTTRLLNVRTETGLLMLAEACAAAVQRFVWDAEADVPIRVFATAPGPNGRSMIAHLAAGPTVEPQPEPTPLA